MDAVDKPSAVVAQGSDAFKKWSTRCTGKPVKDKSPGKPGSKDLPRSVSEGQLYIKEHRPASDGTAVTPTLYVQETHPAVLSPNGDKQLVQGRMSPQHAPCRVSNSSKRLLCHLLRSHRLRCHRARAMCPPLPRGTPHQSQVPVSAQTAAPAFGRTDSALLWSPPPTRTGTTAASCTTWPSSRPELLLLPLS